MSYYVPLTTSTLPLLLLNQRHGLRRRENDNERREKSLLLNDVTKERWDQQAETIRRLFSTCSMRVVMDIMWSVYQINQQSRSEYDNRVKGVSKIKQERSTALLGDYRGEPIMSDLEFDLRLPLPYPLNPASHRHQEYLLYNVDRCVYRLFDPGSHGWSATAAQLVKNNVAQVGNTGINNWQYVSDQCYSASIFAKADMIREVEATLQRIIHEIRTSNVFNNANVIDKLWRILFQLRGLEKRCPQLAPFQKVLGEITECSRRAADFAAKKMDAEIPGYIHQLAECLGETPPTQMDATLRVGMFKTIKEIRRLTGETNATVLSMWSYYCKVWEPLRSFNQDEYMSKLQEMKAALDMDLSREQHGVPCEFSPESQVAIAYHYAYGVYYICQTPDALEHVRQVKDLAVNLPCLTSTNPWWTLGTQAFAFSTRVLADQCRRHARIVIRAKDYDTWSTYCGRATALMQLAVDKLESGDVECRIRAAMLATSLARWLREWNDQRKAEEYEERASRLYEDLRTSH